MLTQDFAHWSDFKARPNNDQQVDLFPIPKEAFVKFVVQRLTEESDIGLPGYHSTCWLFPVEVVITLMIPGSPPPHSSSSSLLESSSSQLSAFALPLPLAFRFASFCSRSMASSASRVLRHDPQ